MLSLQGPGTSIPPPTLPPGVPSGGRGRDRSQSRWGWDKGLRRPLKTSAVVLQETLPLLYEPSPPTTSPRPLRGGVLGYLFVLGIPALGPRHCIVEPEPFTYLSIFLFTCKTSLFP